MDHGGCDGRQGVVVAEFDFGDGEGIVLIYYWDYTHLQEFGECILGVEVLCSLGGSCKIELWEK